MSKQNAEITALIDRLDHPDAGIQNRVLDQLSRRAEEAGEVVLANLPVVNARIRRALLRWLDGHLDGEATLPLMRYVFDQRGVVAEQMGRSLAMGLLLRRAKTTDSPQERGRLRAFAEDIVDDEHPDVRRVAVRILAYVGQDRSIEAVEPRLEDDEERIRDAAQKTLEVLRRAAEQPCCADDAEPPGRLRRRLLNSAGPLRRQLVRRWRRHPHRAKIAMQIIEAGGQLRERALRMLLRDPDDRVRGQLPGLVHEQPRGDLAALALRLLAKIGQPHDTTDGEVEAVRRALHSSSMLVRAAGCRAAASLGLAQFVRRVVALSESRDIPEALDAARSLEQLLGPQHHELLPKLLQSLRTNDRRRRNGPNDADAVDIVAHLLAGTRTAVSPNTIGVERLHRAVFDILEHSRGHRPLCVTGIQVLLASTPREGLDEFDRWDRRQMEVLLSMLEGADEGLARRVGELLKRGAPHGAGGLDEAARGLWDAGAVSVADVVVPLLKRAGTDRADRWLERIAEGDEEPAATEASRVLRRRRGDSDVIDVEFIPRNED